MSIKKISAALVIGLVLTSCSSRGWSCKARYVHAKPANAEKKIA
jgi:PBP1b-binding outer membrane lipoprotein LpoB